MWVRAELKSRAKQALRTNGYWVALLVIVILMVLTGFAGGAGNAGRGSNFEYRFEQSDFLQPNPSPISPALATFLGVAAAAYAIFVANPLRVGGNRFFLEHRVRPSKVVTLFRPFTTGYLNAVKTMFM